MITGGGEMQIDGGGAEGGIRRTSYGREKERGSHFARSTGAPCVNVGPGEGGCVCCVSRDPSSWIVFGDVPTLWQPWLCRTRTISSIPFGR